MSTPDDRRPGDRDDYLWDGSGTPDPEVQRLEGLLRPLRYQRAAPAAPARRSRAWRAPLAIAAALLVAAAGAFLAWRALGGAGGGGGGTDGTAAPGSALPAGLAAAGAPRSWAVTLLAGAPSWSGAGAGGARLERLAVGAWLETDSATRANIEVADIGHVELEPNTRVRLVETRPDEHRLALARGTIHAAVSAPPRLFLVDTPSATAVDLGCEYSLAVDPVSGIGRLEVTRGQVELDAGPGRPPAFVPAGMACETRPGRGPGTPARPGASAAFRTALAALDFEGGGDAELVVALAEANSADALSVWHLLAHVAPATRAHVYDRLADFYAPPAGVTREATLALEPAALARWRDKLLRFLPGTFCVPGTVCGAPL